MDDSLVEFLIHQNIVESTESLIRKLDVSYC